MKRPDIQPLMHQLAMAQPHEPAIQGSTEQFLGSRIGPAVAG